MKRKYFNVPLWLTTTLVFVFLIRIPSFFEPFYYGDEMIYLTLGTGIRKGLILYKDIHDNKPPFLYFLAAMSGNVFWFRALLCMWIIATIVAFWCLTKALFKNPPTQMAATLLFAFFTSLPLVEGYVANAELFMLLPTILALLVAIRGKSLRSAFFAGIFLSLAALFKVPSIFDVGAVIGIWFFTLRIQKTACKQFLLKTVVTLFGLSLPILITFLWYFLRGAFHEYFVAAFLQNFGYVSSWGGGLSNVSFLSKHGPLIARLLILIVGFLFLFVIRKKRSAPFLIGCGWLLTSLFASTLSARPYPHYFVQLLPSVSLLMALLLTDETLEQVLVIFPLSIFFLVAVYFNFWQYQTSLYFGRFITLLNQGQTAYFNEFSPVTTRNYEIAKIIRQYTDNTDRVFVWGDSATIYALSRRVPPIKYVADYHIRDFSSNDETFAKIKEHPPKMLVFLSEAEPFEDLLQFAKTSYVPLKSPVNATIWYNTNQ